MPSASSLDSLTVRQLEVLGLMAQDLTNAEIAARLFISENTVKFHVRQVLRRLAVSHRREARQIFLRNTTRQG